MYNKNRILDSDEAKFITKIFTFARFSSVTPRSLFLHIWDTFKTENEKSSFAAKNRIQSVFEEVLDFINRHGDKVTQFCY